MQDQLPRVPRGPEPACPQRVLAQRQTAADFIGAPAAPWEAALGQRPQSALGQRIRQISGAWEQPGRGRVYEERAFDCDDNGLDARPAGFILNANEVGVGRTESSMASDKAWVAALPLQNSAIGYPDGYVIPRNPQVAGRMLRSAQGIRHWATGGEALGA